MIGPGKNAPACLWAGVKDRRPPLTGEGPISDDR